jgi:hypothetical protein
MFGASQLMFGYFDIPRDEAFDGPKEFQKLIDTGEFTAEELRGIARDNALRLFPQFASGLRLQFRGDSPCISLHD